jgi:hypothetical protein
MKPFTLWTRPILDRIKRAPNHENSPITWIFQSRKNDPWVYDQIANMSTATNLLCNLRPFKTYVLS